MKFAIVVYSPIIFDKKVAAEKCSNLSSPGQIDKICALYPKKEPNFNEWPKTLRLPFARIRNLVLSLEHLEHWSEGNPLGEGVH
jgi:hypothetical protein